MAHPQLLSLHVLFLLSALLAVIITDTCGLVYLIGLRQRMNGICLRIKHGLIASACAATVATGLLLVVLKPEVMAQSVFWMKMVFVAVLCVNGWLIGRKIPLLTSGPFKTLGRRARWTLAFGSMASLMRWIGAAFLGLMI
jgi:hypothetical protein